MHIVVDVSALPETGNFHSHVDFLPVLPMKVPQGLLPTLEHV